MESIINLVSNDRSANQLLIQRISVLAAPIKLTLHLQRGRTNSFGSQDSRGWNTPSPLGGGRHRDSPGDAELFDHIISTLPNMEFNYVRHKFCICPL